MSQFHENSFRELFEANKSKVYNISLNIVQNIEDAEDITQEVFVEVFRSLPDFKEASAPSTWIYRIAVNKSLDFIRAKKRKKRLAFLTQLFHPETGALQHEAPCFEHPGVLLENKEKTEILYKAINQLPGKQKAAFVLCRINGFTPQETSVLMGLSGKATESLLQRAKENLKKILGNFYDGRRN